MIVCLDWLKIRFSYLYFLFCWFGDILAKDLAILLEATAYNVKKLVLK